MALQDKVGSWQSVLFSAMAPMMAVSFTNPFDVTKVQMQLQGELVRLGTPGVKPFRNFVHCAVNLVRREGAGALQRGLRIAWLREGSRNLVRIGAYDPVLHLMHPTPDSPPIYKRMFAGALVGAAGALSCNPMEILKTRLQSTNQQNVGYQHNYKGVMDGAKKMWREAGWRGLFVGANASMVRSILGTSVGFTMFSTLQSNLRAKGWEDAMHTDTIAGVLSSAVTAVVINPVDVVRTRMYNQPPGGMMYQTGWDAFTKIIRKESPFALFKGVVPSYLRLGPHFTLTFVFLNGLRRISQFLNDSH